ncbi:MAG: 2Fe-2S iron-sulfur cluster binding domain-containing protein [Oscillospiraceae bacterium]|nr:2Fe-2S iron-sulfur cluster binding domain-containing protein [Oscillospiraceae bacterium]
MNKQRQLLKITAITPITPYVRKFRLESADPGQPLAPFQAGQYLNLFYRLDGSTTCRPYSIASSPKDAETGFYELYIHGGGPFTACWLFAFGHVGMPIEASVPEGDFCYLPARDGKKVIGISGGMSVTPLYSLAKAVVDGTLDIDLTLFCGWDTLEDVLYYDEFAAMSAACPNFRAVFLLAQTRHPGYESGFVSLDLIRQYTDPADAAFFMCGPAAMYETLDRELAPLNIPADRYHRELPGEAKCGAPGTEGIVSGKIYTMTVRTEKRTQIVRLRSNETVLIALERAALHPEARCRSGHCGYCEAELLSGQVFVPERWRQTDHAVHPCCSVPLSDLEIEI